MQLPGLGNPGRSVASGQYGSNSPEISFVVIVQLLPFATICFTQYTYRAQMAELFPWSHSIAVMRRQRQLLKELSGARRLRDELRRTNSRNLDDTNRKGGLLRKVARKLPQRGRNPANGHQRKAKPTEDGTPEAADAPSCKQMAQATFLDCGAPATPVEQQQAASLMGPAGRGEPPTAPTVLRATPATPATPTAPIAPALTELLNRQTQLGCGVELTGDVKRTASVATASASASGATTPTALDQSRVLATPAQVGDGKPSTDTPQQPTRARAEAAIWVGKTQPKVAPLQLSDPPTLHELLACQAAMGFGSHAEDADLCREERQAYAATMPYGQYMHTPLKNIPDSYVTNYIGKQPDYWDPSDEIRQLLTNLLLVGVVKVFKAVKLGVTLVPSGWRGSRYPGACGTPSSSSSSSSSSMSQRRVEVATRLALAVVNQQPYADAYVPELPGEPSVRFGRYKGWPVGQIPTGWIKEMCTKPDFRSRNEDLVQQLVSRGRLIVTAGGQLIATDKRPTRRPDLLYEEIVRAGRG